MLKFVRFGIRSAPGRLLFHRFHVPLPAADRVIPILFVIALTTLGYLLGATAMYFHLPSSEFLRKAFIGGEAWYDQQSASSPLQEARADRVGAVIVADHPGKTSDGFTLYTTTDGSWAHLIDMQGKVVHRWEMPFSRAWPLPAHVRSPAPDNHIHWFRCHLYPNGDLLAVYHAEGDTPYGYGLVKLNMDSKILWTYSANVHHDVAVAEDGTIYTLTQEIAHHAPEGLYSIRAPYLADNLVVLSSEGKELNSIPIMEAIRDSPYALMLASVARRHSPNRTESPDSRSMLASVAPPEQDPWVIGKGDILHANSVQVVSRAQAANSPLFKPGQVLISLRSLHAVAVVDVHTRAVTWAAEGLWRYQHDAELLENGRILIYDNLGSFNGTRIIEYDPVTQAVPWFYANEASDPFSAYCRGMKQRLSNGNTLIVNPDKHQVFEVTPEKDLVWNLEIPVSPANKRMESGPPAITGAWRCSPDKLTFLPGGACARP